MVRVCRISAAWWLGCSQAPAQSEGFRDYPWRAFVCELVVRRESLDDEISPFRQGAADRIEEVMEQYVRVFEEFGGATLPRLRALEWALSQFLDPIRREAYARDVRNSHLEGSVTSFGAGDLKCNKLVADAYAHGAREGLSVGSTWGGPGEGAGWPARQIDSSLWPPLANHLAKAGMNLRSLTDSRPLRQAGEEKAAPDLGDVISFPMEGDSGHTGLYLGKNLIVSAKATGIEIGPVEAESRAHGGAAMIRKFNGTGR